MRLSQVVRSSECKSHLLAVLPATYHSDSLRGTNKVFCYRDYGVDIVQRLEAVGFIDCEIYQPQKSKLFGYYRPVVIARKA